MKVTGDVSGLTSTNIVAPNRQNGCFSSLCLNCTVSKDHVEKRILRFSILKLNTGSDAMSELVAADQTLPLATWVPLFLEAQGHSNEQNVVCQDNQSKILLENDGEKSRGERTGALNARHFMVTDQVKKGHSTIRHCPADDMSGDHMTKDLQGIEFLKF